VVLALGKLVVFHPSWVTGWGLAALVMVMVVVTLGMLAVFRLL
jgi:hypothetical protein